MSETKLLQSGAIRFEAEHTSAFFTRLHPRVLYFVIDGPDLGELGGFLFDRIERTVSHFGTPVDIFIDGSRIPMVAASVFEQWTEWLRARKRQFGCMHVLTGTKSMELTISIARHLAKTHRELSLHSDLNSFYLELAGKLGTMPNLLRLPSNDWKTAEPVIVSTRFGGSGSVTIEENDCRFTFEYINNCATLSTICGADYGSLGDAPFDHMETLLKALPDRQRMSWFIDARKTEYVCDKVTREWTQWLGHRQELIDRVDFLPPPGAMALVVDAAQLNLGTRGPIYIHKDLEEFEQALHRKAPQFRRPANQAI